MCLYVIMLCIFTAFITHSASLPQIKFMFQYLLEDLRNKTVLDVGSRTGAVLYGVSNVIIYHHMLEIISRFYSQVN